MSTEDPNRMDDLLRAADPARSLVPLRHDEIVRLTEDTMTRDTRPTAPAASRARRIWIAGGAAAAGVAALAIALPLALAPGGTSGTLVLPTDAGGPAAMCAEVTPAAIAASDVAFRADVVSIEDGTVTLEVTRALRGDLGDTVAVAQGEDSVLDGAPIVFEEGETYLIAANEGTISTCGVSGVDSPELSALYDEAFPG